MVDHERRARMARRQGGHEAEEMRGFGAHVEREVALAEQLEGLLDRGMLEKIRIGIAVHEVPDADHGLVPPPIE